jgi:hypothetical protein
LGSRASPAPRTCLGAAGVVEWLAFRLSLCKRFSAIDLHLSCAWSSSDGRARSGVACPASASPRGEQKHIEGSKLSASQASQSTTWQCWPR